MARQAISRAKHAPGRATGPVSQTTPTRAVGSAPPDVDTLRNLSDAMHDAPRMAAQRQLGAAMNNSPRVASQRKLTGAMVASIAQPQAAPPIQRTISFEYSDEGEEYDDNVRMTVNEIVGELVQNFGFDDDYELREILFGFDERDAIFSDFQELVDVLVQRLGGEVDDPEAPVEIPTLIHFIWMGRPPSKAAVQNILAWAQRAQNTNWQIWLWTDGQINTGNWGPQLQQLAGSVQVHQIRNVLDQRLQQHYSAVVDNAPRAFNMASDMARYSILSQYGGVYADVDLGPGQVNLNQVPILSINDIPIMAPQVRDRTALNEQLDPKEIEALDLSEQVNLAATRAYARNQLNNNLIVSGRGSEFMRRLIENVAARIARDRMREGWAENAALISGPQAVITTMFDMVGPDVQQLIAAMDPDTLRNWSQLQWLTAESEAQEYDSSGKDSKDSKSSKDSDKKQGDKCFLTTACVEVMGLADSCEELTCLREFRDGYMASQADGPSLIAEYYRIAPDIVAALKRHPQFKKRAMDLYERLVLGSIALIKAGQHRQALEHYRSTVSELQKELL